MRRDFPVWPSSHQNHGCSGLESGLLWFLDTNLGPSKQQPVVSSTWDGFDPHRCAMSPC